MSTRRVLVVDDEDMIRDFVAEALSDEGYDVEVARNGQEALEKARQRPPHAIVLDLMMPIMDGWTFVDRSRREPWSSNVPIVVMSAATGLAATARDLGVRACLAKPFDLDALIGAVDRLTRQAAA